jgi:hypothetical protein
MLFIGSVRRVYAVAHSALLVYPADGVDFLLRQVAQIRSQSRLSNRFGVVVIVLLPLHEEFDIDRRNDPRLMPQRAQRPADEVRT